MDSDFWNSIKSTSWGLGSQNFSDQTTGHTLGKDLGLLPQGGEGPSETHKGAHWVFICEDRSVMALLPDFTAGSEEPMPRTHQFHRLKAALESTRDYGRVGGTHNTLTLKH